MKIEKEDKMIKLYSESIKENVTSWIEQDIILPDTKPDAIKVVNVTVNPYVTDVEPLSSGVKVTGRLNYFIIYKANDSEMGIRGVLTSSPYSEILNLKNINTDSNITVEPKVKNVIFALPNERKISVKTEVIFRVNASNLTEVPLTQKFVNSNSIQTKIKSDKFNNIIETKCENIVSREDIMLPEENSDFGEILKVTTEIINKEYKQSYNKLLVKGDILLKILYLSTENVNEVKKAELLVPFTSMVEFNNIKDVSEFDIRYNIKDFNVKANSDITSSKTISVDYQIAVCVLMFEKEEISYVDDFYSEDNDLTYDTKNARVVKSFEKIEKNIEIKSSIENAINKDYGVVDYEVDTSYLIVKENDDKMLLEGNLKINVLSENIDSSDVESKVIDIHISERIEIDESQTNNKKVTEIKAENVSISQNKQDLSIKVNLIVCIEIDSIIDVSYAQNIDLEELTSEDLDSMSIYIVKPNDTLWSIAKKYKTNVQKIATINNIENPDVISVGQKLLIIR
ncbi:MAG: DUF3794 domain-containing protein [Clostridia bacterium]|nr:DUF3794 domain-containing protein [Clostridia bacterium]